jgi:hypothetical protein
MSCCGKKREEATLASTVRQVSSSTEARASVLTPYGHTVFEYIGKTAMTTIGPLSGRRYRFGYPGALLEVDSRDSQALESIPNLRKRLMR